MLVTIANFIQNSLPTQTALAAIVLDTALRLFPSGKPLSLIMGIQAVIHQLAIIFGGVDVFVGKVIPQNIKPQ